MARITITRLADGTFHVQTPAGTSHEVSVPAGFPASLGCGHVAPGELVRASFEFLLEREPAAAILRPGRHQPVLPRLPGRDPRPPAQQRSGPPPVDDRPPGTSHAEPASLQRVPCQA